MTLNERAAAGSESLDIWHAVCSHQNDRQAHFFDRLVLVVTRRPESAQNAIQPIGGSANATAFFVRLLRVAVRRLERFSREHVGLAQSITRLPPQLFRFPPRRLTAAPERMHLARVLGVLERIQSCFDS